MGANSVRGRSFTHPETEFYLPSYPVTHSAAGIHNGEPTGEVVCAACWESALHIAHIDHDATCPQRFVRC